MLQRLALRPAGVAGHVRRRTLPEGWLYLTPVLLWFAAFAIFPTLYIINVSLRDWSDPAQPWVGFANYAEMLRDGALLSSLRVTIVFSLGTLALSLVLGLGVALLLAVDDLWGKTFFRSVLIVPFIISPVVVGVSFRLMLHPILGVINYVLGTRGWDWLGSPQLAMPSIIILTVWELTPFVALILLAGLLSLPRDPYEAARIDGAGAWRLFRHLTLPLLRPVIQVAVLMSVIDILKVFALVYATTEGGPARSTELIGLYIWRTGFRFYRLDYASAMAVVLLIVISFSALLMTRALGERAAAT